MKKIKLIILSLSIITVMAGAAIAPALGAIAMYFSDVDADIIKLIITLPSLLIIITSLLFNQIANRMSGRAIAITGLVLYIIGGCGAGFVDSIYMLLGFRILLGIGVGLIMPLSTGLIPYFFEKDEQSELMGYASALNNLGGIIALGISGVLISINWRYSFAVYFLGLIELILIVLFLPSINLKGSDNRIDRESIKKVFPYTLSMFVVMVIFYALTTNFSIIMTHEAMIPTSLIGLVMAIQNAVAFIIGMKLNSLITRLKANIKYLGIVMFVVGFFVMGFASSIIINIAGLICIGMGFGILVPLLNSQIAMIVKKEKAPSAMAFMSFMLYLGQFLSPILIGFIEKTLKLENIKSPYYIAGIIGIGLMIGFTRLPMKNK